MRRRFTTCPKCGFWHPSPIAKDQVCECGHVFEQRRPTTTTAAWGNKGGRSLRFAFDPAARAEMAETAPATASAIKDDGTLVYESDSHQKRVFREMAIAKQEAAAERESRVTANDAVFLNTAQA